MNKTPLKEGNKLFAYIPQRPPFVMVDKLFAITENSVVSGLHISADNVLVQNNRLQASGMIENMAQTCALFAGYRASELGKVAPVGFIAAVKDVAIKSMPKTGTDIYTKIEIVNELMNMQIAHATIFDVHQTLLGVCELRIFIKEED